ncbi:MAG TPA: Ig-like domain-containing protein [Solirubrobacteraceae bacterium]
MAALVALAALVVGSTGVAMAAAPTLAVVAPVAGSSTREQAPPFSGTTDDALDPVKLDVYAGTDTTASPVQTLVDPAPLEVGIGEATWSAAPASLAPGQYTAVAEQTNAESETGTSPAVTFTVDTTPPVVSVTSPAPGAVLTSSQPNIGGEAGQASGDDASVTLKLYAGAAVSGSPMRTLHVAPIGAGWTTGAVAALPDGKYTAQAEQSDAAGNTGVSAAVTFEIDTTLPAVTLTSPAPGSTTSIGFEAFSGAAGTAERDLPQVTVKLFAGATIAGRAPLKEATVPVAGGRWSAAFGELSPGTYTARAQQNNNLGGTGLSEPVTFTVKAPAKASEPKTTTTTSTSPAPTPTPAPQSIPVTPSVAVFMQPFPVVRIAGSETASGARVGLLTVQAPVGATVNVTCRGPGCPVRTQSVLATPGKGRSKIEAGVVTVVLQRFERSLRAGVVLEIRVSKPGQIGKFTRFTVRHGRLPTRTDLCLSPSGIKPIACPS